MLRRIEFTDKAVEGLESLAANVRQRVFKKNSWLCEIFYYIKHKCLSYNLRGLF